MEKILAFIDSDPVYMERFSRYMDQHSGLPVQIHTFRDTSTLQSFASRCPIDILLHGDLQDPEVLQLVHAENRVHIGTSPEQNTPGEGFIYKYQPGDAILRELMSRYGDWAGNAAAAPGRTASLYTVFSPLGHCGKTSLALSLAAALSDITSVLYCTLEESSWLKPVLSERGRCAGISDAFYYFRQKALTPARLKSLLLLRSRITFLPPASSPEDLTVLPPSELQEFLQQLRSVCGCSTVILDTDSIPSRFLPLLPEADRVFIPIREDSASLQKLSQLEEFLKLPANSRTAEKCVRLKLPEQAWPAPGTADLLTPCMTGPLRGFAEELVRNYIFQ